MRREDIVIGTEYCETGPLAYGAEPNVHPNKVRFLTPFGPHTWVKEWEVVGHHEPGVRAKEGATARDYPDIKSPSHAMPILMEDARRSDLVLESDRFAYAKNRDVGFRFRTYDHTIKGHLLVERWSNYAGDGKWTIGLCSPASIHRTWAEYEERQARNTAHRHDTAKANAPQRLRISVADALEAAALIAEDHDGSIPAHLVYDEVYKQTEEWPHLKPT